MSFQIEQIFKQLLGQTNIFDRLNELENWRNRLADPTLSDNVKSIQSIELNLTQNVVPQIQNAANIASQASNQATAASDNAFKASNQAIEAKNLAEGFLLRIQDAETNALNAATNATNSLNQVQDFANRLKKTGEQLQTDLDAILAAESKFRTVLLTELDAIRRQLNDLAAATSSAGDIVKKEGEDVKAEMDEVVDSLNRPISDLKEYLRRIQEDSAVFIPFNASMVLALITSSSMVNFVQTFAGAAENPTLNDYYKVSGHGTIVEEIIEGFKEVGVELVDVGNSMKGFADTINAETKKLGDRLILSSQLINDAFKEFIDTFHRIFLNLSYTLRGEIAPE